MSPSMFEANWLENIPLHGIVIRVFRVIQVPSLSILGQSHHVYLTCNT
jgi:hypothetical protein